MMQSGITIPVDHLPRMCGHIFNKVMVQERWPLEVPVLPPRRTRRMRPRLLDILNKERSFQDGPRRNGSGSRAETQAEDGGKKGDGRTDIECHRRAVGLAPSDRCAPPDARGAS